MILKEMMIVTCDESIKGMEADENATSAPRCSVTPSRAKALAGLAPTFVNAARPEELSPEQLAERARAGCLDSFERLVSRYENQIYNFLHQFTRNRQDAEDLTQETFLKAYRGLQGYKSSFSFACWLFTIARRSAASHFRSLRHFEELPAHGQLEEEDPASLLETKDEQNSIWRLAKTLKPKQCEAFWLHYWEGFSVAETARIMRTNQIYVKVLLHRARTNLAKILSARGGAGRLGGVSKQVKGVL